MHCTFRNRRKSLAEKLGNPNLLKITFKTFRHWKASFEYHRTKDLLFVQRFLGHKNINTTQVYAKIVDHKVVEAVNKLPSF